MFGQGLPLGFAGGGAATFTLRFLGIAGGTSGVPVNASAYNGQGGGAGEYLEVTGLTGESGQNYQVIVGAGGGGDTRFRTNGAQTNTFDYDISGYSGAGGRSYFTTSARTGASAVLNEAAAGSKGNSGGNAFWISGQTEDSSGGLGGGGGGAGGNGGNAGYLQARAGSGGAGFASDITGTSTLRAGGGGGGGYSESVSSFYLGAGGSGGGGRGGYSNWDDASNGYNALNGTANTGSGGGARGGSSQFTNGTGGSGVVIVRYPNTLTITVGPGLTSTTTTTGTDKVTTFTAGSDNISFA